MYIQHTQLSQLVQAQPCSWEINGVESQQAFAWSWAPCPPYVEQLSGGILAPPPRKDVASRKLQGVESFEAHIKICPGGLEPPPPRHPFLNSLIRTGQKRRNRRGGGCSAELQYEIVPFTPPYPLVCAVKLQPIVKQIILEQKYKQLL